ncbi:purine-binding chemotaxis protein CheW [Mangrovimicrobium sediminis]|uniref:Purine-binding chemotaxis protein CheW n=1 Tax=Mangrovimicrobium sediminis TaxID=2562682 RepID=A0A4Z0M7T7_9GAMM|nr:chemotaxis protein CheW [Haliea sp. SAOS-164]TGD75466.1 purine-binding chemotaxis protein CheW [Haliea sp. SAOS-164]
MSDRKTRSTESEDDAGMADACEIVVFQIDELKCALNIRQAQEINRNLSITAVPEAPVHVKGVANLRGKVITVVDLRVVFGIQPREEGGLNQVIVIHSASEEVGLLVDYVDDIVYAVPDELHPPPANLSGIPGEFFTAIYKKDGDVAGLINLDQVLGRQ